MLHSPSRVSALALALLGSSLLASSGAGAVEVAPTVSVGYTILNLYRSGLNAVDDTCPILSQAADGSFGCTTGRGYPLVGKVVGITNNLGAVVANKITFTIKVSATTEESYTGAIIRTNNFGDLFAAGTYASSTTKIYSLVNGTTMRITYVADPLPFAGDLHSIGG